MAEISIYLLVLQVYANVSGNWENVTRFNCSIGNLTFELTAKLRYRRYCQDIKHYKIAWCIFWWLFSTDRVTHLLCDFTAQEFIVECECNRLVELCKDVHIVVIILMLCWSYGCQLGYSVCCFSLGFLFLPVGNKCVRKSMNVSECMLNVSSLLHDSILYDIKDHPALHAAQVRWPISIVTFVYDCPASLNIAALHVNSRALSSRTSMSANLNCKSNCFNHARWYLLIRYLFI